MTRHPILNQFLNALVAAHGLSPMTQTGYRWKLTPLFDAWEDIPIEEWDYPMFEDFISAQEWGPRTLHKFTCCCRRFIKWTQSRKLGIEDFTGNYRPPKPPPAQPKTISRDDLVRLLDNCIGHRMEVAVGLAGLAGLRRNEISVIRISDLDFEADQLRVYAPKTKKLRYVPMSVRLREILSRHLEGRGEEDTVLNWPAGQFGGTIGNGNRSLHALAKKSGVKPIGFHFLRHTFATLVARAGTDINTLAALLGHSSLEMTLIYVHADTEDKVKAVAAVL